MTKRLVQFSPVSPRYARVSRSAWRLHLAVCLSVTGLSADAAPVELSNPSLDEITAAPPAGLGLQHESDQPSAHVSHSERDEDVAGGTGIVVGGSEVVSEFGNEVVLADGAQQELRAANVVNTALGASASGANVLSIASGDGVGAEQGAEVSQSNRIEQAAAHRSELGRYSVADGRSTRSFSDTGSEYRLSQRYTESSVIDRSGAISVRGAEFQATVPARTIGDLVFEVQDPPPFPDIEITFLEVGQTELARVVLESPTLALGDIVWSDEKGIELKSATLTFPAIKVYLVGQDVASQGGRSISLGPVTLVDIENPVDELGAVSFAAYGSGVIETTPGGLTLHTEIDLRRILEASVGDLEAIGIPGTNINFGRVLGESLPVFDLSVSAELDPFQGLAGSFGNDELGNDAAPEVYCYPPESTTCNLIESTAETTTREQTMTESSSNVESHGSGHARSETHSQRAAVEVRDAEANIIVLEESTIDEERYDVVLVVEGAQNGMRVLNGVNASRSITGNGVNIVTGQGTAPMPVNPGPSYSQVNRIVQIGGL